VASAVVLLAGDVLAQSKAHEPDLRTLRASFRQGLLSAILPEKRGYIAQLRELEKQLISARDYETAIKVRDERLALEQDLTAFEQELPGLAARAAGQMVLLPERIMFRPQDATLSGIRLEKDGTLAGWDTPQGGTATWRLPSLPAGGYEVIVTYMCQGSGSASFEVRENFYVLRGKVPAPAPAPVRRNLGTLRIRDGAGMLTLASDSTSQPGQLRVVALELAPVNR
jgi:hypothetical protein